MHRRVVASLSASKSPTEDHHIIKVPYYQSNGLTDRRAETSRSLTPDGKAQTVFSIDSIIEALIEKCNAMRYDTMSDCDKLPTSLDLVQGRYGERSVLQKERPRDRLYRLLPRTLENNSPQGQDLVSVSKTMPGQKEERKSIKIQNPKHKSNILSHPQRLQLLSKRLEWRINLSNKSHACLIAETIGRGIFGN